MHSVEGGLWGPQPADPGQEAGILAFLASLFVNPAFAREWGGCHDAKLTLCFGFECAEDNLITIWDNLFHRERLPKPGWVVSAFDQLGDVLGPQIMFLELLQGLGIPGGRVGPVPSQSSTKVVS